MNCRSKCSSFFFCWVSSSLWPMLHQPTAVFHHSETYEKQTKTNQVQMNKNLLYYKLTGIPRVYNVQCKNNKKNNFNIKIKVSP